MKDLRKLFDKAERLTGIVHRGIATIDRQVVTPLILALDDAVNEKEPVEVAVEKIDLEALNTELASIEKGLLGGWKAPLETLKKLAAEYGHDADFAGPALALGERLTKTDPAQALNVITTLIYNYTSSADLKAAALAQWSVAVDALAAKDINAALTEAATSAVVAGLDNPLKKAGARKWVALFQTVLEKNPQAALEAAGRALDTAKMFSSIEHWGPDETESFEQAAKLAKAQAEIEILRGQLPQPKPAP